MNTPSSPHDQPSAGTGRHRRQPSRERWPALDKLRGDPPVPLAVWRRQPPANSNEPTPGNHLPEAIAEDLLPLYTPAAGIVVDLSGEPELRAAAQAAGRDYLELSGPDTIDLPHPLSHHAALVVIRPRPPESGTRVPDLGLLLARHLLAPDGYAVLIADLPDPGADGSDLLVLSALAERIGLGRLRHVLLINSSSATPPAPVDLVLLVHGPRPSGHKAPRTAGDEP